MMPPAPQTRITMYGPPGTQINVPPPAPQALSLQQQQKIHLDARLKDQAAREAAAAYGALVWEGQQAELQRRSEMLSEEERRSLKTGAKLTRADLLRLMQWERLGELRRGLRAGDAGFGSGGMDGMMQEYGDGQIPPGLGKGMLLEQQQRQQVQRFDNGGLAHQAMRDPSTAALRISPAGQEMRCTGYLANASAQEQMHRQFGPGHEGMLMASWTQSGFQKLVSEQAAVQAGPTQYQDQSQGQGQGWAEQQRHLEPVLQHHPVVPPLPPPPQQQQLLEEQLLQTQAMAEAKAVCQRLSEEDARVRCLSFLPKFSEKMRTRYPPPGKRCLFRFLARNQYRQLKLKKAQEVVGGGQGQGQTTQQVQFPSVQAVQSHL